MRITIIGAGAFGTAMAHQLAANKQNEVRLLFRNKERAERFNRTHINEQYFPNLKLENTVVAESEWDSLATSDLVLVAVPAKSVEAVIDAMSPFLKQETLLVNLVKGIYEERQTLVDLLISRLNHQNTVTLKGPSFGTEMMHRQATLLTLGFSRQPQLRKMKQVTEKTNLFLDYTTDVFGVELLSAIKNVYAILLGLVDAKYDSANTRFLALTKSLTEVELILQHLGGKRETLFLGCGVGDLGLTGLTDLSRNRTLGLLIGKGFYNDSYQSDSVVLEGVKTLELIHAALPENLIERLPLFQKMIAFFMEGDAGVLQFNFEELFEKQYKTVLTYGTFDLLHFGHLEILRRAKALGDRLIVGLSTDEFNEVKGKKCTFPYEKRKMFLESLSYVDLVIPEHEWEQKKKDVEEHEVDIFVMGDDWKGKFDFLKPLCDVYYLSRTRGVSTTKIKNLLSE